MKCECVECGGTGEVACPDCDGEGSVEGSIEAFELDPSMPRFKELRECQRDAKRVIKQAARLTELRPTRSSSYSDQLRATLKIINKEADAIAAIKQA